jgi:hypothetical protein
MNTINPIPSSLQNHLQDKAQNIDRPPSSIAEVQAFMAKCHDMIERVRVSLIKADLDYRGQRATIANRFNDEIQKLDDHHDRTIAEHQALIRKLEELRS